MNSQFLLKPIPMARILEIANCHFQDVIPFIDPNSNNSVSLSVPIGTPASPFTLQSIGNYDFLVTHIVADYTTVVDNDSGGVFDDGVCRMLFNIHLGGWNRDLARNPYPMDQFFTPGRVRHPSSTNNTGANQCAPSNPLLIPRACPLLLLKNQAVTLNIINSADVAQKVSMSLCGWRVTINEKALEKILDSIDKRGASSTVSAR